MAVLILDAPIKAFAEAIEMSVAKVVEYVTLDLWNRITKRTPVKTGAAKRSWQLGIGTPNTSTAGSAGATAALGSPSDFPGGDIDGTQTVYITSSLGYVQFLEEGSSKQAAGGMVRVSIAEVQAEMDITLAGLAKP